MADNLTTANQLTGQAVLSRRGQTILINELGKQLLRDSEPAAERLSSANLPADRSWLRQSFITMSDLPQGIQASSLSDQDRFNRSFTTASMIYTDTSPGGNNYINNIPSFTRYADIRPKRIAGDTQSVTTNQPAPGASLGMGRYMYEAVDRNSQVIHMRFGVANFNSLTTFLTGFYSGELAANARAARYSDSVLTKLWIKIGQVVGLAVAPLFLVPLAVLFIGTAVRFMLNMPASAFYNLKPAMPMYWMAVNNIVNQLAVNSGLSSYVDTDQAKTILRGSPNGGELKRNEVMNIVGNFLPPGLIKSDGTIDVFAIANRTNRADIAYQERLAKAFENAGPQDTWDDVVKRFLSTNPVGNIKATGPNFEVYFKRFLELVAFSKTTADSDALEQDVRQGGLSEDGKSFSGERAVSKAPGFIEHFTSQLNDGGEWVSYRVDYTGAQQDSFSNTAADSSLAAKMNDMSRRARDARFNLADGNINELVGGVINAVRGVVSGAASVVQVEGLMALAGSAFVNIPKQWSESSTNLARTNYTLTLMAPYGNPVSILLNIWLPLATLLAGVLPLATGKQSHTSPYLCQLHDRGRSITRLGLITDMSISRGTSNVGFTREGVPLAIEVSFSVTDLSSIVAMPVTQGFDPLNPLEGVFDSENAFTDYLMTLAGMKLSDTIYRVPMLKYQINKKLADVRSFFTMSHFASYAASLPGVEILGAAMKGTNRQ